MKKLNKAKWCAHIPVNFRIEQQACKAVCGQEIGMNEWSFLDGKHASMCVGKGDRMQPCQRCWDKVKEMMVS